MKVRLGQFLDFCLAPSTGAKVRVVRDIHHRLGTEYDPAFDYWKPFREGVRRWARSDGRPELLDGILTQVGDARKLENYRSAVDGLKKWVGRKEVAWIGVTAVPFVRAPLTLSVDPELGISLNGEPYSIKLFPKVEPRLTKVSVDPVLRLLDQTHPPGTTVGVLDVRASKLFIPTTWRRSIDAQVQAEIASFAAIWDHIADAA